MPKATTQVLGCGYAYTVLGSDKPNVMKGPGMSTPATTHGVAKQRRGSPSYGCGIFPSDSYFLGNCFKNPENSLCDMGKWGILVL